MGKNSLLYYKANKSMNYGMFKHAFSVEEIYTGLNKKLLKGRWVKNRYKNPKQLAAKIFKDCFCIFLPFSRNIQSFEYGF